MTANRLGLLLLVVPLAAVADDRPQPGTEGERWSKYDFVPGAKALFFEDFVAVDPTSPLKHLKNPSKRLDVSDHAGGKWLRCRPPCDFDVVLPETLPDRFTIDFDLDGPGGNGLRFNTVKADGSAVSAEPVVYADSSQSALAYGDGGDKGRTNQIDRLTGLDVSKPLHFSWSFDGAKVKGYAAQVPGLDVPDLKMPRTARLHFEFVGGDDPDLIDQNVVTWITNLRIAAGGNPILLDELTKKGRVVLNGILFDTAKDRIRPESTPTLVAVAKLMTEHPELKLIIEGHTDNQGVAAANQTLSTQRATAVKAWLVAHKVAGTRLESKGLGQTKPVGTNDTAEGRQANRRVELVRR